MELNGEVLIAAPRERVWAALNDTEVLRRCIPGCEAMDTTGEHEKTATVAIKIGPVRARFNGRVRMDDIREGEGCTLQFDGQGGAAGMARGSSRIELSDEASSTRLRYQTQASVAGKLGQVGGRMIDAGARQMADQFFAAFQAAVAPAVSDTTQVAPAQAEQAAAGALPSDSAAVPRGAAAVATATSGPAAAAHTLPRATPLPTSAPAGDAQRVLWFVLGSLSTGFGVWLGRALFS